MHPVVESAVQLVMLRAHLSLSVLRSFLEFPWTSTAPYLSFSWDLHVPINCVSMTAVVCSGTVVVVLKHNLTAVSTPDPCWRAKVISCTLFLEGRPVESLDNKVVQYRLWQSLVWRREHNITGTEISHKCQHLIILVLIESGYDSIRMKNGKPLRREENEWMWCYTL